MYTSDEILKGLTHKIVLSICLKIKLFIDTYLYNVFIQVMLIKIKIMYYILLINFLLYIHTMSNKFIITHNFHQHNMLLYYNVIYLLI